MLGLRLLDRDLVADHDMRPDQKHSVAVLCTQLHSLRAWRKQDEQEVSDLLVQTANRQSRLDVTIGRISDVEAAIVLLGAEVPPESE